LTQVEKTKKDPAMNDETTALAHTNCKNDERVRIESATTILQVRVQARKGEKKNTIKKKEKDGEKSPLRALTPFEGTPPLYGIEN